MTHRRFPSKYNTETRSLVWEDERWRAHDESSSDLWYVVDDRQMYRPGETVRGRGWIRQLREVPRSLPRSPAVGETVSYRAREPNPEFDSRRMRRRSDVLTQGTAEIDPFGGFEFHFPLPEDIDDLGTIPIRLGASGVGSTTHRVEVQQFRRPEHEVTLDSEEEGRGELTESLPDTLTRYRVMAVAVDDTEFGAAEDEIAARIPVMVNAAAPRFANVGDQFELGAVVHNRTDETRTVEVSTSATQMHEVSDALRYINEYHFDATPHLASRMLSMVAMYDILEALDTDGLIEAGERDASIREWIDELEDRQRSSGGFDFWPDESFIHLFSSIHALLALSEAADAGYDVPDAVMERGVGYLAGVEDEVENFRSQRAATIRAYAAYPGLFMTLLLRLISPKMPAFRSSTMRERCLRGSNLAF